MGIKKTLIYFYILVFLFLFFIVGITQAQAVGLELTGWGESGVDGTYTQEADINGFSAYTNGLFYVCHYDTAHTWAIRTYADAIDYDCDDGQGPTGPAYYTDDSETQPYFVSSWNINWGASPAGTIDVIPDPPEPPTGLGVYPFWGVTSIVCGPSEEEEASTTTVCTPIYGQSTSSVPMLVRDDNTTFALAVIVFLLCVYLVFIINPRQNKK